MGAAQGDQGRQRGLQLQLRPFDGPLDPDLAVRHFQGHRQGQMGQVQKLGHHDAHLVLIIIHGPMAADK